MIKLFFPLIKRALFIGGFNSGQIAFRGERWNQMIGYSHTAVRESLGGVGVLP